MGLLLDLCGRCENFAFSETFAGVTLIIYITILCTRNACSSGADKKKIKAALFFAKYQGGGAARGKAVLRL